MELTGLEFDVVDGRAVQQRAILAPHDHLNIPELEGQIIIIGLIEAHAVLHRAIRILLGGQAQGHAFGTALCGRSLYLFNGGGCQCNHAVCLLFTSLGAETLYYP